MEIEIKKIASFCGIDVCVIPDAVYTKPCIYLRPDQAELFIRIFKAGISALNIPMIDLGRGENDADK